MQHIALTGGMGTGKTTLAHAICEEEPRYTHMPMSRLAVDIPLTLLDPPENSHLEPEPDLLHFRRDAYIKTIIEHLEVELTRAGRKVKTEFVKAIMGIYGKNIVADLALHACSTLGRPLVLDNVLGYDNMRKLKEEGIYHVHLTCALENQFERRLADGRPIDTNDPDVLRRQIIDANALFEVNRMHEIADKVITTNVVPENQYAFLARYVLERVGTKTR